MAIGILSHILESHEDDHACMLGDLNATPGSPRFNEIYDMLNANNVMFRYTDILPDNTYTHVNNGSQTCSWRDHISMPDVLFESIVDCHTLQSHPDCHSFKNNLSRKAKKLAHKWKI